MTRKVVLLEDAKRLVENLVGHPESVTGGEHNYRCPKCLERGFSRRSHMHVRWIGKEPRMLCHQCRLAGKGVQSILEAIFGSVPQGAYRSVDSDDFAEDIDSLLYGEQEDEKDDEEAKEVPLPAGFTLLTEKPKDRLGEVVLKYLLGRVRDFQLLHSVGAGYCTEDRMRGYAIFQVIVNGQRVTWTSRRVVGLSGKQLHATGSKSKRALFNYDNCHDCRRLFVTEGPFDALAFHCRLKTTDGGIATLGTVLHDEQAALIAELPNLREVVFCYDEDATAKAHKMADKLSRLASCTITVMELKDSRDPDELDEDELREAVKNRYVKDEMLDVLRRLT